MKLRQLEIRLLPGLDDPFTVDFDPDAVNVITGPNASGKSSLIRAVRALLYPERNAAFCQLRAEWLKDGQVLACERRGTAVTWFEAGSPIPRPKLPGMESMGAFLISSEDLNALGSTDEHISSQLRTMLAGGYDLDAVLQAPALASRPKPQKLAREVAQLASRVADKESEYAQLHEELGTLERLNRELNATTDAAVRLRFCEDALALAEATARRGAIEQTLIEEYSGGMDRLRGDELARLDQVDEQLRARERELAIEHGALRRAREKLEKTGTVDPHALEALQSELGDQRDHLTDLERQIAEQHEAIEQHQAAVEIAARRLGDRRQHMDEQIDQTALEELEKLVDRVQVLREQIRNLTAELTRTHISSNVTGRSQADLRNARQALLRWLEGARLSPLEGVLWGGLGLTAAIASWRLLSVQQISASPELILLCLIAIGVPATLLVNFANRWRDLNRAQADFIATDIEPPMAWVEAEVEARIERLDLELESATRHEISQARAADVRQQLNSQRTSLDRARERLKDFAGELGLSAESRLETGFQLWCRHLHDWQQKELDLKQGQMRLDQLEVRYRNLQESTRKLLARHGMAGDRQVTSRDLGGLIHLLNPRMRRNTELHNEVHAHQRRIEELQADIVQLQRSRDQVFEQAGLKPGDHDSLNRRSDQYESWRELEQQRRDCSLEITRLEKRLEGDTTLLKQANEQQRDALENLHEELATRVAQRDQINRRIAEIHTRHDDVLKRRELEAMAVDHERQRQLLDDELDHHLLTAAAETLIEDVRQTHQADNEPVALKRAGEWFDRFTRHRYKLQFADDRFMALDLRARRQRALTELSTGTRVQLLLAVRLAWVEHAEHQVEPLPVFMDEVLTTTDPDRYRAVVESVQEIVTAGRQMFYLTAQSDDARAWEQWAGDGPSPHLIDMAEVRHGQVEPLQYTMPIAEAGPRPVPDPEGMNALDWARAAGVAGIDPWQDTGQMHCFHMLHDRLDLAARLVRIDLARLGELGGFLQSEQVGQLLDHDEQQLLGQRLATVSLILDDWRQRHDRPVDEAALAKSGAVSEHFMGRVSELNARLGGDPRALIEGLRNGEVSRFRNDNTDQLEQWLTEQNYLHPDSEHPRLSAAEISARTGLDAEQVGQIRQWIRAAIQDPLEST